MQSFYFIEYEMPYGHLEYSEEVFRSSEEAVRHAKLDAKEKNCATAKICVGFVADGIDLEDAYDECIYGETGYGIVTKLHF